MAQSPVASFAVIFPLVDRFQNRVFEYQSRVGEIDAVFFKIRAPFMFIPFEHDLL